jgi:hypothetical protein
MIHVRLSSATMVGALPPSRPLPFDGCSALHDGCDARKPRTLLDEKHFYENFFFLE